MAFSWNFFARDYKNKKPESTSEAVSRRNPNYATFRNVNNDIQQIVATKSVISRQVAEQQPIAANPVWQTLGLDSSMLLMPVASNKTERLT